MTGRVLLLIAWIIGVVAVGMGGTLPDGYRQDMLQLPEQPYPVRGVATFLAILTFECAVLWGILRPKSYNGSWLRALLALLFIAFATLYFGIWLMHAPPYMYMHFLWLVFLSLALILTGTFSVAKAVASRLGA